MTDKPSTRPAYSLIRAALEALGEGRGAAVRRHRRGVPILESVLLEPVMNVFNKNIEVYYNLRKKCLSVRKRGLVVDHVRSILLKNAEFVVQPAGRKRVLKEKRKNVHAYVRGERVAVASFDGKSERITYNPYKNKSFVSVETGKPVYKKDIVSIVGKNILGQ